MGSMWLSLLFVMVSQGVCSEVIRPMADVDFKIVSIVRELANNNKEYVYTIDFTGPTDTQVDKGTTSRTGNEITTRLIFDKGFNSYTVKATSSSKGVTLKVIIEESAEQDRQDTFPLNTYQYQIERKQMVMDGLLKFTAQIRRPADEATYAFIYNFIGKFSSTAGEVIDEMNNSGLYHKYTTFVTRSSDIEDFFLHTGNMRRDGISIKEVKLALGTVGSMERKSSMASLVIYYNIPTSVLTSPNNV